MTWQAKRPGLPGDEVLEGKACRLVPLTWPDAGHAMCAMLAAEDASLWTWMTIGPFEGPEGIEAVFRTHRARGLHSMIIELPGGEIAGSASFMRMAEPNGAGEIGTVVFGKALQRSRAGTEAIYLMLRHLFDDYGWRRVEWLCNANNEPSFRAGQRYGFTYEGTLRQHRWVKGQNRDTKLASMLDSEWPAHRHALEAWLADENFDADGRQKRKLESFR